MKPASSAQSPLTVVAGDGGDRMTLKGSLDIRTLAQAEQSLTQWWLKKRAAHVLDLRDLSSLDTPGALFLCGLRDRGVELSGVPTQHRALLV